MSDDRAEAGEGPEADKRGQQEGEGEKSSSSTKTQDLTKAGRKDMDPDAGTE